MKTYKGSPRQTPHFPLIFPWYRDYSIIATFYTSILALLAVHVMFFILSDGQLDSVGLSEVCSITSRHSYVFTLFLYQEVFSSSAYLSSICLGVAFELKPV